MTSTPSPLGVSLPLSVTQNPQSTLWASVQFCVSGTGWVLGHPRGGPPPHPGPAVHSHGFTALHYAAKHNNRRIVRSLVGSGADVNAQNDVGCAVSAIGESAVSALAEFPPPSAVQAHAAALGRAQWTIGQCRRAVAARRRRGRPGQRRVPLRCAAQPNRNRSSRARAGARRSNTRNVEGSSHCTRRRRGWCPPPPASPPRHPRLAPAAPSLPTLLVPADVLSVHADGVRRSSGQGGDAALAL
jgi:hypothetical protein